MPQPGADLGEHERQAPWKGSCQEIQQRTALGQGPTGLDVEYQAPQRRGRGGGACEEAADNSGQNIAGFGRAQASNPTVVMPGRATWRDAKGRRPLHDDDRPEHRRRLVTDAEGGGLDGHFVGHFAGVGHVHRATASRAFEKVASSRSGRAPASLTARASCAASSRRGARRLAARPALASMARVLVLAQATRGLARQTGDLKAVASPIC